MEESSLRLVLLGLGVIIVMSIYFYDSWKKKRRLELAERKHEAEDKVEPVISNKAVIPLAIENEPFIDTPSMSHEKPITLVNNEKVESAEEIPVAQQAMVVQLAVVAKPESAMEGSLLKNAFTKLNLEYGEMNVFHRYQGSGDERLQCFHVTNMLEPGTFPSDSLADFESTGLMLFFQSSDVIASIAVFDEMLATAKELAAQFGATIIDAEMNELAEEKIIEIRSQLKGLSGL